MSDDMNPVSTPGRTVYRVDRQRKRALLKHLMTENDWSRIMVYVRTKYAVARLGKQLEQDGFTVALVHNSMGKVRRADAVEAFANGNARVLVSSDMATRGMELPTSIDCVINLDLPTEPCLAQRELHLALTENKVFLLSHDEEAMLHESPLFTDADYQFEVVEGFEPDPEAQKEKPETAEAAADGEQSGTTQEKAPRKVRRGHAARKKPERQARPERSERQERRNKPNHRKQHSGHHAALDENGDVNGNTLVSDNSNRSAIELACDGNEMPQKRGNSRFKNRQGGNGQRRNRRQVPSIMGG